MTMSDGQVIQYGLTGIKAHTLIATNIPAAKLSNSSLQHLGEYWLANGSTKALRHLLKPPTLRQLDNIYYGIQAHQLMFYLNLYLRLEQNVGTTALPPTSYCLWQKPGARQVWEYVLQSTIATVRGVTGVRRAVPRARISLRLWLQLQNFYVNLPPSHQRSFHESRLYTPGKRESHWQSRKLLKQLERILGQIDKVAYQGQLPACFVSGDTLLETPVHLYIRVNALAALMCWVQPDQISVFKDQKGEIDQVIVYDHKFEQNLPDKSALDNFGRLQILMLALAGRLLAKHCLDGKRRKEPFAAIPCYRLTLDEIPIWLNGVRVIYQQPDQLDDFGGFKQVEMTLTENEIAGAVYDLEQVIVYLANPSNRNGLYAYLYSRKRAQEGVTPEAMFTPKPTPFQLLLGI
jgi:hypothetical protein